MASKSQNISRIAFGLLLPGSIVLLVIGLLLARSVKGPGNLIAKLWLKYLSKRRKLYPYIIAQAIHESAGFTSNVYKRDHNIFGMKHASKRKQLGTAGILPAEGGGSYQIYKNDLESFRDHGLWMDSTNFPAAVKDATEYVSELKKRNYFGDTVSNYLAGLQRGLGQISTT